MEDFKTWQPALLNFLCQFVPCSKIEDSDEQYTTLEIKKLLEDHAGEAIPVTELYASLMDNNFDYVSQGSEMLWLFKRKD